MHRAARLVWRGHVLDSAARLQFDYDCRIFRIWSWHDAQQGQGRCANPDTVALLATSRTYQVSEMKLGKKTAPVARVPRQGEMFLFPRLFFLTSPWEWKATLDPRKWKEPHRRMEAELRAGRNRSFVDVHDERPIRANHERAIIFTTVG